MKTVVKRLKKVISGFLAAQLFLMSFSTGIAFAAVPTVGVNTLITNDATPALSGSVSDPAATLSIVVGGNTYSGTNNGDGTWTLANNTIAPGLSDGVYDVAATATATDGSGDSATDITTNELTIDTLAPVLSEVTPVTTPTNDQSPSYQFSSTEVILAGDLTIGGGCSSSTNSATAGTNTITFGPLGEGTYGSCTITGTDAAGNSDVLAVSSFVIDITPPDVSGVAHGGSYSTSVTPTFTEGTATLTFAGSENPFTTGTTLSAEGVYVLEVTDTAGNKNTIVFSIDTTAPVITLNGLNPLTVERGTTYTEPGATTDTHESVSVSGSVNTAVTSDYTLNYDAVDAAGNQAVTVTRTVLVRDSIYPNVNAGTDKVTRVPVFQNATANDGPFSIANFLWTQYDPEVDDPGTVNFTPQGEEDTLLSATADGIYLVRLNVTDAGGNSSYGQMQLTWDTTAPSITMPAGTQIMGPNAWYQLDTTVTDATSGVASYQWAQTGGTPGVAIASPTSEDTFVSPTASGIYQFSLTVTDNAGNVGTEYVTVLWDQDLPTVSNLRVITDYDPYVLGDGVGYEIRADVADADSGINGTTCEYSVNGGTTWDSASYAAGECSVAGLTATDGQSLNIQMRVADNANNVGTSGTITRTADAAAPQVTGLNLTPSSGLYTSENPTLTGTITDSVSGVALCEYNYRLAGGAWTGWAAAAWSAGTCTASITGLVSGNTYEFAVRGQDAVGHWSEDVTDVGLVTITRTVDNIAPTANAGADVITNQVTSALNGTALDADSGVASIAWSVVSQPAGSTANFSDATIEDPSITIDTDGQYVLQITVADNVGLSASDTMTLWLDRNAPEISNVAVAIDYDPYVDGLGFDITADVSDAEVATDSGIASCEYSIGGGWNAATYNVGLARCEAFGVTAGDNLPLAINVRVYDRAGNVSTATAIDRTSDAAAPVFGAVTINPDFAGFTSANPTVLTTVSDVASDVESCEYSIDGGATWNTANLVGTNCSFNQAGLVDGATFDARFRATDSVGHVSQSGAINRIVDAAAPAVNAGENKRVNKQTNLDGAASDGAGSGIATIMWTKISGPGNVVFVTPNAEDTLVSADKDGVYVLRLTTTDNVGNVSFDEMKFVWDTKVNTAKGLDIEAGDHRLELSWINPSDSDLAGIRVYRSLKSGTGYVLLATVSPKVSHYVDLGLKNGTEYFYMLRTFDKLGNTARSGEVSGIPHEPILFGNVLSGADEGASKDDGADKDIKSGGSDKTGDSEKDQKDTKNSSVPFVGLLILLLLIALGLYLLYLQNPRAFEKFAFWKRSGDDARNGNGMVPKEKWIDKIMFWKRK